MISREDWLAVQMLLKANARSAPGNKPSHRYAGLLQCGDCGSVFVPMIRYWNANRRVGYVCRNYHRGGKAICSSHRIHEEMLDEKVVQFAQKLHHKYIDEQMELKELQKSWEQNRPRIEKEIAKQHETISRLEQEIDVILMERILSEL